MEEKKEIIEHSFSGTKIGDVTFYEALSNYYSDFLSTDFKKGQLPKRKFTPKDNKGRRSGISLAKFPKFEQKLRKKLTENIGDGIKLSISYGSYKSELPLVTQKGIQKSINSLELDEFTKSVTKLCKEKHEDLNKEKNLDLETFQENIGNKLHHLIAINIGKSLIDLLEPVFEKSSSNLLESLIGLENDIASILTNERKVV